MKKTWIVKYIVALVLGVVLALVLNKVFNTGNGVPVYVWFVPILCLSLIMVWKIISRFVTYSLDRVDVGDKTYNVLFRFLLILDGFLLLIPVLLVGCVLVVLNFIKELTVYRDAKSQEKADKERKLREDAERAEFEKFEAQSSGNKESVTTEKESATEVETPQKAKKIKAPKKEKPIETPLLEEGVTEKNSEEPVALKDPEISDSN